MATFTASASTLRQFIYAPDPDARPPVLIRRAPAG